MSVAGLTALIILGALFIGIGMFVLYCFAKYIGSLSEEQQKEILKALSNTPTDFLSFSLFLHILI